MAKVRIDWNIGDFEEIRRLPAVDSMLEGAARSIAAACGDGYEVGGSNGKSRSRRSVFTRSYAAMKDNARNNTLLRNVGQGRQ